MFARDCKHCAEPAFREGPTDRLESVSIGRDLVLRTESLNANQIHVIDNQPGSPKIGSAGT